MDYLQYDDGEYYHTDCLWCFKPYYKWITFNIEGAKFQIGLEIEVVLNLIINGLPSILTISCVIDFKHEVLNLIINGLPSIF